MVLSAADLDEITAADAQLAAELEAKENGERVILLVCGHEYGEVIRKSEISVTLVFHNRYAEWLTSELENRGFKPVIAYRILKGNGNLTYLVPTPDGPDVYTLGKYFPALRKKK